MRFQVIDGQKWLARRERYGLTRNGPNNQPANKAGARGGCDAVEMLKSKPSLAHRRADNLIQAFGMGTGRDFRHHAAINFVLVELRADHVREDTARAVA